MSDIAEVSYGSGSEDGEIISYRSTSASPTRPVLRRMATEGAPRRRRNKRYKSRVSNWRPQQTYEHEWPPSAFFQMASGYLNATNRLHHISDRVNYINDGLFDACESISSFQQHFGERWLDYMAFGIATNGSLRSRFNRLKYEQRIH